MKRFLAVFFISALILGPGSATALSGDCNNDGQVDQADLDALKDSLNASGEHPTLTNCDYNKDGVIGADDLGAHLKAQN
jgi:hypothetical protein